MQSRRIGVGLAWWAVMGSAASAAPLAPLVCARAASAPVVDGRLDEAAWKGAVTLTEGPVELRGVLSGRTLYLGIRLAEGGGARPMGLFPRDEAAIYAGSHAEILVRPASSGEVWRVAVTPEGRVYDARQSPGGGAGGGWTTVLAWTAKTAIQAREGEPVWTAELAVELTEGDVHAHWQKVGVPPVLPRWHAFEIRASREAGATAPLSEMTEAELAVLAADQAADPATAERKLRISELHQQGVELLASGASEEKLRKDITALAAEVAKLEGTEGAKDLQEYLAKEIDRQAPQLAQMSDTIKALLPKATKEYGLERALVQASSLPAFVDTMKQQFGEKVFAEVPDPLGWGGMYIGLGFGAVGKAGKPPRLPKGAKWEDLTEDQFRAVRAYKLMAYTPAGLELSRRKMQAILKSRGGSPAEEAP